MAMMEWVTRCLLLMLVLQAVRHGIMMFDVECVVDLMAIWSGRDCACISSLGNSI